MISLFRHYVPIATLLQLALEGGVFFVAMLLAIALQAQGGTTGGNSLSAASTFAGLMICVNSALGVYRRESVPSLARFAPRLLVALLIGFPIAYLIFFVLPDGGVYQDALGYTVFIVLLTSLGLRRIIDAASTREGPFTHRILVLGTGPDAQTVDQTLSARPGLSVVGFYPIGQCQGAIADARVVGGGRTVEQTVQELAVDEVIVAVREQRGGVIPMPELLSCRMRGVRVTTLSAFFERVGGQVPIDTLKASWLVYGEGFRQSRLRTFVKRSFDICVASVLLVLALPLMIIAALIIRCESGGPVIYRQERVGRAGKPFTLLKFRSMRADAESDGRARWAQTNDPRVTPFGRFMRRSRIDELPQLWNVLKGEMSFVGPRPERPCFVAELERDIPYYAARHSVKPGITGWAQVRYSYGASTEETVRKLQYDLYYVKNHSLLLDLFILFETVRVVVFGEGAR
jgi:sugar transferase (PEP-CTERM system associated)